MNEEKGGRKQSAGERREETECRRKEGGNREQEKGGRKQGAGERREETECRRKEGGNRVQEKGGRKQSAGERREETESRRKEGGNRVQEKGGRKQSAGERREETECRRKEGGNREQEKGGRKQRAGERREETDYALEVDVHFEYINAVYRVFEVYCTLPIQLGASNVDALLPLVDEACVAPFRPELWRITAWPPSGPRTRFFTILIHFSASGRCPLGKCGDVHFAVARPNVNLCGVYVYNS
ncbi:hypothetical protein NQZ68_021907 [Dissostichus eleginoides]|nr:hypothetical protein NQZ68_021907 [Dissostichus eleginoides]